MADDDKHAGRTQARRPSDKRRFVGLAGAVFVPHPLVDEETIATKVESGEWTPVEDKVPAKKTASKPSEK
ncbi:MAG TPA: hypothetical protein VIP28_11095 [Nocardioides sp.]